MQICACVYDCGRLCVLVALSLFACLILHELGSVIFHWHVLSYFMMCALGSERVFLL